MPIEIREVVIKAQLEAPFSPSANNSHISEERLQQIKEEIKSELLEKLSEKLLKKIER